MKWKWITLVTLVHNICLVNSINFFGLPTFEFEAFEITLEPKVWLLSLRTCIDEQFDYESLVCSLKVPYTFTTSLIKSFTLVFSFAATFLVCRVFASLSLTLKPFSLLLKRFRSLFSNSSVLPSTDFCNKWLPFANPYVFLRADDFSLSLHRQCDFESISTTKLPS